MQLQVCLLLLIFWVPFKSDFLFIGNITSATSCQEKKRNNFYDLKKSFRPGRVALCIICDIPSFSGRQNNTLATNLTEAIRSGNRVFWYPRTSDVAASGLWRAHLCFCVVVGDFTEGSQHIKPVWNLIFLHFPKNNIELIHQSNPHQPTETFRKYV